MIPPILANPTTSLSGVFLIVFVYELRLIDKKEELDSPLPLVLISSPEYRIVYVYFWGTIVSFVSNEIIGIIFWVSIYPAYITSVLEWFYM